MGKCICIRKNSYFEIGKIYNYNIFYSERYERNAWDIEGAVNNIGIEISLETFEENFYTFFKDLSEFREERINKILND